MSLKTTLLLAVPCLVAASTLAAAVSTVEAKPRKQYAVQRVAAVTGLAASHDLRREGNRLCFSEHTHYGSSVGQPNQKVAQIAAIRAWSDFVDLEYGGTWSSFARASCKDLKCSPSNGGWGCDLAARPCR